MALNRTFSCPHAYEIAGRWRDDCLQGDGSLFTPGSAIWTKAVVDDLYGRFVEHPDESKDSFMNKFARQLEGAPDETIQLAAEVIFMHLLPSMNTSGERKRDIINTVLGWSAAPVAVPDDLASALESGLYGTGVGFNTHRPYFLRYVLELLRRIKSLTPDERRARLSDPWVFRELVYDTPADGAPSQRDSVLHLLFPKYYETIAAMDAKKEILARWADLVKSPDANPDRQLYELRESLTQQYGEDFDFWDDTIIRQWRPTDEVRRWDDFVTWAKLFAERGDFDAEERDYKLEIGERLKKVRTLLLAGQEEWLPELKRAFGPPNNLTDWRLHDSFLKWCEAHREEAAGVLVRFWSDDGEAHERIAYFRDAVPREGQGSSPLPVPVFLLAGLRPTEWPPYRATPFNTAYELTKFELPPAEDGGDKYDIALDFLDRLMEEAGHRGLQLRDRLDAQSVMWCVTNAQPPEDWSEDVKQRFHDYLKGAPPRTDSELVEPYATLFADYDEAERAFGLLSRMAARLGLTGPSDPRFACTLRSRDRILTVNFCNWPVAKFQAPGFREDRLCLTLLAGRAEFGDLAERSRFNFKVRPDESEVVLASLPGELIGGMDDAQQGALDDTLDFIADRFASHRRCPWRRSHNEDVGRAIFDPEFRMRLLTGAPPPPPPDYTLQEMAAETGFAEAELQSWVSAVQRKKQAILYGPPGTGKTYVARRLAQYLVASDEAKDGFFELVQFHPAYAYEDFIQGIRPQANEDGDLSYELEPGRFLDFIEKARQCEGTCVLIVDEINRANLARVFGELMYLLEYRDDEIELASGGTLRIPANVRLIGTMNTADRSIALVDHALRRRFAFLELQPKYEVLRKFHAERETGFPVSDLLAVLAQVNGKIGNPHYYMGISFFLDEHLNDTIESVWRTEIHPYLDEHFFDRPRDADLFTWEAVRPQLEL